MAGNTPGSNAHGQIYPWLSATADGVKAMKQATEVGIGAAQDMWRNYKDMKEADTINADKYFHCRGNCEAAQRGPVGAAAAAGISELREIYGMIKGDPIADRAYDQYANHLGRSSPSHPSFQSCRNSCDLFAPRALAEKYRSRP